MSSEEIEKKVCRYCGKMTSVHANFCWYCARELEARPERPMEEEKSTRPNWLVLGILAALILLGGALLLLVR